MSSAGKIVHLADRGVISLSGTDAKAFLDNIVTNDMDQLGEGPGKRGAIFAGLLTPQGKILFEFFVVRAGAGYFLETQADQVAALVKRLSMYKLRAKVEIRDLSPTYSVFWADLGEPEFELPTEIYADPRAKGFGHRKIMSVPPDAISEFLSMPPLVPGTMADYHARRVALGVAEAPHDYALGDTFPHDANWDRYGVSFTKGCYVGQEVVSRMQNKSVVRKRVVKVSASSPLTSGADILIGDAVIGRIGTTAGTEALAMLRLDRAAEAEDKGQILRSPSPLVGEGWGGGQHVALTVDPAALAAYRDSVKNKPVIDL